MNAIAELSFDFVSGDKTPMFVKLRYTGSLNEVYDHEGAILQLQDKYEHLVADVWMKN